MSDDRISTARWTPVKRAVRALKDDLLDESGPRISTLRNYPFAILVYEPKAEWEMRREVAELAEELKSSGWYLHTLNMQALMLQKLRDAFTPEELAEMIELEKELSGDGDPTFGLEYVGDYISDALQGRGGLAEIIVDEIEKLAEDSERADRTVVFIGQLGTIYPFTRTSALLRFLDGRTQGIPVVFLYPGKQQDGGLRFLSEADPDRDYRPRIYDHDTLTR